MPFLKIKETVQNVVIQELIQTEKSYIHSLDLIVHKLIPQLTTLSNILTPAQSNNIFLNVIQQLPVELLSVQMTPMCCQVN